MWIFTRDGYFSAVQHNKKPGKLLIRARRRSDLEDLLSALGGGPAIFEDKTADYRYRLVVDRRKFAAYVADQVMDLDYVTSVKDELDKGENDRHQAMLRVWSAMGTLQPGGPYGGQAGGYHSFVSGSGHLSVVEGSGWQEPTPADLWDDVNRLSLVDVAEDDAYLDDLDDDANLTEFYSDEDQDNVEVLPGLRYEVVNGEKVWFDTETGERLGVWT